MKKILIVVVLFMILITNLNQNQDFSLLDYFNGEYYSYTTAPVGDNFVNLGNCYMNFSSTRANNIIGESMVIKNFEVSNAIKVLNAQVKKTEYLQDGTVVIYAFTNKINRDVNIDGEKVNLQIACYEDYSVLGWPLILGSF